MRVIDLFSSAALNFEAPGKLFASVYFLFLLPEERSETKDNDFLALAFYSTADPKFYVPGKVSVLGSPLSKF